MFSPNLSKENTRLMKDVLSEFISSGRIKTHDDVCSEQPDEVYEIPECEVRNGSFPIVTSALFCGFMPDDIQRKIDAHFSSCEKN